MKRYCFSLKSVVVRRWVKTHRNSQEGAHGALITTNNWEQIQKIPNYHKINWGNGEDTKHIGDLIYE